jgi:hypothetical protein
VKIDRNRADGISEALIRVLVQSNYVSPSLLGDDRCLSESRLAPNEGSEEKDRSDVARNIQEMRV